VHRKLSSLRFNEKARGEDSLLQESRNDGPMVLFARSTSDWPIAYIESGPSRIRPHDVVYAQDSCALAAYDRGTDEDL